MHLYRLYFYDEVDDLRGKWLGRTQMSYCSAQVINSLKKLHQNENGSLIDLISLVYNIVSPKLTLQMLFLFFGGHIQFPSDYRGSYRCENLRGFKMHMEGIWRDSYCATAAQFGALSAEAQSGSGSRRK